MQCLLIPGIQLKLKICNRKIEHLLWAEGKNQQNNIDTIIKREEFTITVNGVLLFYNFFFKLINNLHFDQTVFNTL